MSAGAASSRSVRLAPLMDPHAARLDDPELPFDRLDCKQCDTLP